MDTTQKRYAGQLLTVKEVAAILRISGATVCNWVNDGRLAGATIGKKMYRIHGASVDAILIKTLDKSDTIAFGDE